MSKLILRLAVGVTLLALACMTAQAQQTERTATGQQVTVYLVALDDAGRSGRRIGCDDSLVPVRRPIAATSAPLRAALQELLSIPREGDYAGRQLMNFWDMNFHSERSLRLDSVALRAGVATIRISGVLPVAGICDVPRITSQIEQTARQFPTVRRVRVYLNGTPLSEAIR